MCIQSCINLPHSQQHRLKDHSHPRLRTSRTASAPPLSNIFGQSLGFAKRRLLYNRQCKVAKQPWPSPCRNDLPGDILVRDGQYKKGCFLQTFTSYVICWTACRHEFHLEVMKLHAVPFIDTIIQKDNYGFTCHMLCKQSCSQQQ